MNVKRVFISDTPAGIANGLLGNLWLEMEDGSIKKPYMLSSVEGYYYPQWFTDEEHKEWIRLQRIKLKG